MTPGSTGFCLLSSTEANVVNVNFAFGATGTAEGRGVNNKLGTDPGFGVGVLVLVDVGEGVGVGVKVGVGDGLDVLVGARTTMMVGVSGVATTIGAG